MTDDTIRKALTVLGYTGIREDPVGMGTYGADGAKWPVPLDLASLLRRCRERGLCVQLWSDYGNQFHCRVSWIRHDADEHSSADPTEALLLALAAMHEATKEITNGN